MPRSDETYLEAFIDYISTLPHEVRRNLELMKDMDKSCATLLEEMARLQQEYVGMVEEKILSLEVVDGKAVRVLGDGDNNDENAAKSADNNDDDERGAVKKRPAVIPTTEELAAYVHQPSKYQKIQRIQQDCIQRAEEKVAIADQTYSLVDNVCKRLDSDLADLEKLLQSTGEFQAPGAAKPNDLAAINVTPGTPDWILAKVISHNHQTGMYKLSDEDTESNKTFNLPETQVVILGGLKNLSRGDIVFAVYPDTTSFYQATIVQAPRKVTGSSNTGSSAAATSSGSGGPGGGSFVMVNFVDDSDEHGITHDKAVLLKHVMLPPYGVTLQ